MNGSSRKTGSIIMALSAAGATSTTAMYHLPAVDLENPPPFHVINGEAVLYRGDTANGGYIYLTNYRLYLHIANGHNHIPLGLVECVEQRELFHLHVACKDARTYGCTFATNEMCTEWYERLLRAVEPPTELSRLFAFYHYVWSPPQRDIFTRKTYIFDMALFEQERMRLQFSGASWRISDANVQYALCASYPPYLLVPSCITDATLERAAAFRSSRRLPAVVWRNRRNGAVIARCSQPEIGWLGWRCADDEDLIKAILDACKFDAYQLLRMQGGGAAVMRGPPPYLTIPQQQQQVNGGGGRRRSSSCGSSFSSVATLSDESSSDEVTGGAKTSSPNTSEELVQMAQVINNAGGAIADKTVLIMDARSYATAVANRARGGGYECAEYYPNCEIQWMRLVNIHAVRKSFQALRQLCMQPADQLTWFSQLESTQWLQNMSSVMSASVTLVRAVETDARPVLVHCTDGWDRTPQIVALGQLLLDPFYRTIDGFRILIEREWLAFGHKFADRCRQPGGSDDQNERCPIFIQWLDCVHQLHIQFPCSFEFSQSYLVKLAQHTYSNLYGTFLCNTYQERARLVHERTIPIWEFLGAARFRNHLFAAATAPIDAGPEVLWPQCNVRDLHFWRDLYLGPTQLGPLVNAAKSGATISSESLPPPPTAPVTKEGEPTIVAVAPTVQQCVVQQQMAKTRSFDDLTTDTSDIDISYPTTSDSGGGSRRRSDPNVVTMTAVGQLVNDVHKLSIRDYGNITATTDDYEKLNTTNTIVYAQINASIESSTDTLVDENTTRSGDGDDDDDGNLAEDRVLSARPAELKCEMSPPSPLVHAPNHCQLLSMRSPNDYQRAAINGSCCNGKQLRPRIEGEATTGSSGFPQHFTTMTAASVMQQQPPHTPPLPPTLHYHPHYFSNQHHPSNSNNCSSDRCDSKNSNSNQMTVNEDCHLMGEDGLLPVRSTVQERLWQIIEEHRKKEESLQKELHIVREKYLRNVCHKCNSHEVGGAANSSAHSVINNHQQLLRHALHHSSSNQQANGTVSGRGRCGSGDGTNGCGRSSLACGGKRLDDVASLRGGTTDSTRSDPQDSSRSDVSWEALDDYQVYPGAAQTTLWVPDHAVHRCTGCNSEFWVGKRRHHCRKCGRVFCADCSPNSTPLPSEHLFNPVRVCTGCYVKLRRIPSPPPPTISCKLAAGSVASTTNNLPHLGVVSGRPVPSNNSSTESDGTPQIAASSN